MFSGDCIAKSQPLSKKTKLSNLSLPKGEAKSRPRPAPNSLRECVGTKPFCLITWTKLPASYWMTTLRPGWRMDNCRRPKNEIEHSEIRHSLVYLCLPKGYGGRSHFMDTCCPDYIMRTPRPLTGFCLDVHELRRYLKTLYHGRSGGMADAQDSKSCQVHTWCGFKSHLRYCISKQLPLVQQNPCFYR